MSKPFTRRQFGAGAAAVPLLIAAFGTPARAGVADPAMFVKQFADKLVAIVNGPGDTAAKRGALQPVIDQDVDVAAIARFCLARFWNMASPEQQQKYVTVFHQVLMNAISSHLGEYQGVSFSFGATRPEGESSVVATVVTRPNAPPANIGWVVSTASGAPKVVDVLAEGTSMRLEQRADYTSYLSRHNSDIDALIAALQRQVGGG
jgi:phospholipid transport system substrate-binding protein